MGGIGGYSGILLNDRSSNDSGLDEMARPAAFDRDEVLLEAMGVFWRQGYGATSVKDLEAATQLRPGSLYAAFDSKRNLFEQSLEVYFDHLRHQVRGLLRGGATPLDGVRQFFRVLAEDLTGDREHKGCLMVNSLLEIPAEDQEIQPRLSAMFQEIEGEFRAVLERARTGGELPPERDPAELARLVMTGIFGLRVYSRTAHGRDGVDVVARQLLSLIED